MTTEIRAALKRWAEAKDVDALAHAEELIEEAMRKWHDSQLKVVVKTCIRIVSECQGTEVSSVEALVSHFDAVL